MLIRPTLTGSLRSNRGRAAKAIRKADDLFVVMWLSKDTRETTKFQIKSLKFIEISDIIYT